jgi:DHA1 family bicyclomycin/chloramphenicol resistance-like MFS transporter
MLEGFLRLIAIPRFRGYALTLAFTSSVFFAFLGGAPHIMVDVLKRTPLEYGAWFFFISFGYMVGNFLSGRYTQAVGIDRMMLAGSCFTLVGGLLCLAAVIAGLLSPATLFPHGLAASATASPFPTAWRHQRPAHGAAAGWSGLPRWPAVPPPLQLGSLVRRDRRLRSWRRPAAGAGTMR